MTLAIERSVAENGDSAAQFKTYDDESYNAYRVEAGNLINLVKLDVFDALGVNVGFPVSAVVDDVEFIGNRQVVLSSFVHLSQTGHNDWPNDEPAKSVAAAHSSNWSNQLTFRESERKEAYAGQTSHHDDQGKTTSTNMLFVT